MKANTSWEKVHVDPSPWHVSFPCNVEKCSNMLSMHALRRTILYSFFKMLESLLPAINCFFNDFVPDIILFVLNTGLPLSCSILSPDLSRGILYWLLHTFNHWLANPFLLGCNLSHAPPALAPYIQSLSFAVIFCLYCLCGPFSRHSEDRCPSVI